MCIRDRSNTTLTTFTKTSSALPSTFSPISSPMGSPNLSPFQSPPQVSPSSSPPSSPRSPTNPTSPHSLQTPPASGRMEIPTGGMGANDRTNESSILRRVDSPPHPSKMVFVDSVLVRPNDQSVIPAKSSNHPIPLNLNFEDLSKPIKPTSPRSPSSSSPRTLR
eukprot:TRINITY_DN3800_c0_g1_i2.p1 TRINITY_DN3800_c0_g1~~TRINITY_DN3800_c0_g1_i2.p1  ORF type:complete len:164 (+),score=38.28 TRINITY_DN3800_c0_g1_i2:24-515(+)